MTIRNIPLEIVNRYYPLWDESKDVSLRDTKGKEMESRIIFFIWRLPKLITLLSYTYHWIYSIFLDTNYYLRIYATRSWIIVNYTLWISWYCLDVKVLSFLCLESNLLRLLYCLLDAVLCSLFYLTISISYDGTPCQQITLNWQGEIVNVRQSVRKRSFLMYASRYFKMFTLTWYFLKRNFIFWIVMCLPSFYGSYLYSIIT